MTTKKPESKSVSMAEDKQVTSSGLRKFWFPDGTIIEALTAQEAAKLKKTLKTS